MKISELFKKDKPVYSLEVFPPKKTSNIETIYNTLENLKELSPDYISVTYGAGGNTADTSTCDIASIIKNKHGIEALAHLTCINSTKQNILDVLSSLEKNNIHNVLALRGDRNADMAPQTDFLYANDLTCFIKQNSAMGVAGACYPEGHCESKSLVEDIFNLRKKVDAGAGHLISQLFFENELFYSFLERCKIAGINAPIQAGIMPVVNKKQIERLVSLCGASLPPKFVKIVNRYSNNPEALRDAGIAYATNQIVDLIANGVDGIHLYTMNNPYVATKITQNISALLK